MASLNSNFEILCSLSHLVLICAFSGGQSPHELWMPLELLLPDLSPRQEPLATHLTFPHFKVSFRFMYSSHLTMIVFKPKDSPTWRRGGEVGGFKDASSNQPQGLLLGH